MTAEGSEPSERGGQNEGKARGLFLWHVVVFAVGALAAQHRKTLAA